MYSFIELFIFLILSTIFSCFLVFCLKKFDKEKYQNNQSDKLLNEADFKNDEFFQIKLNGIFLIYMSYLIIFFILAMLYDKYKFFVFITVILFIVLFVLSLFYLYKKSFNLFKKDNK